MRHLGLFEGVGGFSLAARWTGWVTVAWCENNPFGQRVLKYHFPEATGHGDIKTTDFKIYANKIDILTGGFPCQPYSTAGKGLGKEDARHLWPEMLRAISEIKPRFVVGENVRGLVSWNGGLVFDEVQFDLENEGYEVFPVLLPACAVNAPHKRERIWFIAHSRCDGFGSNNIIGENRCQTNKNEGEAQWIERDKKEWERVWKESGGVGSEGITPNSNSQGLPLRVQSRWDEVNEQARTFKGSESSRTYTAGYWDEFPTQSPFFDGNDGFPGGLDNITISKWRTEAIKAAGNAIVPQVAYQIFKAIEQYKTLNP